VAGGTELDGQVVHLDEGSGGGCHRTLDDETERAAASPPPSWGRDRVEGNPPSTRLLRIAELAGPSWSVACDTCRRGAHRKVFLGSRASRAASPVKISSVSRPAMETKAASPSHGANRLALPCASSSPSDAEPGGSPSPRKSSAVSAVMEPDSLNGRKVIVATMALGKRWRNMMRALESPSARAARMYSRLRPRRNSARTTPTRYTQWNSRRMMRSVQKPGTS